jgi:hypothetical protein
MPKATISFILPEEMEEFKDAVHVQDFKSVLYHVEQDVFRPARKHGYPDREIETLVNAINDLIDQEKEKLLGEFSKHPRDNMGPLNATDLIYLLEQKYYKIKRDTLEQE